MNESTQTASADTAGAPSTTKPNEHGPASRTVTVILVAPNNASMPVEVDLHTRVDKVAREGVRRFVRSRQMTELACGLALVLDGVAEPLDDSARLEEYPVHAQSQLVLVPKQSKTDG